MSRHVLRLEGDATRGARVVGSLLKDLLGVLVDSAQQSIRLRVEGRSSVHGKPPAWLETAARFEVVGIEPGSTQLVLEAPPLSAAAPEKFAQLEFFMPVDPGQSCLDILAEALNDALEGRPDSELYDNTLVRTFENFGRIFSHGVETLEWIAGRRLRMDRQSIEALTRLRGAMPPDQQVVVAGKLDLLRHSDRMFTLIVRSGASLRGVVTGDHVSQDALGKLWGQPVRVSGRAKFRSSGAPLRIEADLIEPASEQDLAVWSSLPRPLFPRLDERALDRAQGPRSGMSAVFGRWPGDETDEEIRQALEELS